jgi:hypothetical protein
MPAVGDGFSVEAEQFLKELTEFRTELTGWDHP